MWIQGVCLKWPSQRLKLHLLAKRILCRRLLNKIDRIRITAATLLRNVLVRSMIAKRSR